MFKNLFSYLCLCFMTASFFSCTDKDTILIEAEFLADRAIAEIQDETDSGKLGCYDFVFPISLDFEGKESEFMSFKELREAIEEWAKDEPRIEDRPTIVLPIEILTFDSKLITVENESSLKKLTEKDCPQTAGHYLDGFSHYSGNHGKGDFCMSLLFPINLEMPNGEILFIETRQNLKEMKQAWKEENGTTDEKPSLVFPVTVVLEDETEQTLNSEEELAALKESCREE